MNITDRNIGRTNKQIQYVANNFNNVLSSIASYPKESRRIDPIPKQKTISYKKNIPYDDEYARKNNKVDINSYSDDLINSFSLKSTKNKHY